MNRQPFEKPPQWWSPKPSKTWVDFWRRLRRREQTKKHRLLNVEVRGSEVVRQLLDEGSGVLITPNHASHADCFAVYEAADEIGCPVYAMVAWQVFQRGGWLRRAILRQHGCFSVDREGTDLGAVRQAREVLQSKRLPLVIFPEGEVYHLNDRLTPFRDGPAAIALMAARKSKRSIACVPSAIKYSYVEDPTQELLELMSRLERAVHWRPRPELSLELRVYHLAEGLLALKEVELLGKTSEGRIPQRVENLIEFLLARIEARHHLHNESLSVPERVKTTRQHVIAKLQETDEDDPQRSALIEDLDDLFLVVQAFSYAEDYIKQKPTIERIAETLDKFEEDVLGAATATIRGARKAIVTFGEPIILAGGGKRTMRPAELTQKLQDRVQILLDELNR